MFKVLIVILSLALTSGTAIADAMKLGRDHFIRKLRSG